jgi:hypothetical protein
MKSTYINLDLYGLNVYLTYVYICTHGKKLTFSGAFPHVAQTNTSASQRVNCTILALKQKSTSSFMGDDQSICSSPLLKNHITGVISA